MNFFGNLSPFETNAQVHFLVKMSLCKVSMTSSVEWQNGTPRADLVILTFDRSTSAQLRKNKFSTLVQGSPLKILPFVYILFAFYFFYFMISMDESRFF